MIIKSQRIFDKVYLDQEYPSEFIQFVAEDVKRNLVNKLMDELDDHKIHIVELKEQEFIEDPQELWSNQSAIKQDLVCVKLVQCKHCRMHFPWCYKFKSELDGNGFCPYGKEIEDESFE